MANYKEATVEGSTYTRASKITITNPLNGIPRIEFLEDTLVLIGDTAITTNQHPLTAGFDPSASFDLIHPVTGDVLGTATHQDVQLLLYSLYMNIATSRDLRETQLAEEEATRQSLLLAQEAEAAAALALLLAQEAAAEEAAQGGG